ncbi:MAG: fatty acid desaturase [Deltaproteobacteria bacterium]|nr:fatty acid desaturase [Deltaproteobacteria bacterium]
MDAFIINEQSQQIHTHRRKDIIKRYPEVRLLFGSYPLSALLMVGLVALQWALAWLLHEQPWYVILLVAYLGGAVLNHALYVLIHEATHNLIFDTPALNKICGLSCDFALIVPSALSFRKYHLLHHQHLNEMGMDPDVVSPFEGRLIGHGPLRKALWLALLSVSQALRPLKVPGQAFIDPWIFGNIAAQIGVNSVLWWYVGWGGLVYLLLSTFFALGLHPLGGRWIQEHYYVMGKPQETYSYYGPLNWVMFNMGFHNEHHDFPMVAWSRLPQLYRLAPEFYQPLFAYRSYTWLLLKFIFDERISTFSRWVRHDSQKQPAPARQTRNASYSSSSV